MEAKVMVEERTQMTQSTEKAGNASSVSDTVAALKGIPTREELLNLLSQQIVDVTFDKLDGTERVMKCTLIPSMLPHSEREKKLDETKTRNLEDKTFVVWAIDIEPSAWRSFRYDRVKHVSVDHMWGNGGGYNDG